MGKGLELKEFFVEGKGYCNHYFYNGMRLRYYCLINNYDYDKISARIRRGTPEQHLFKSKLPTDNRCGNGHAMVKKAIKYNGVTMKRFCREHIYKCYSYDAALDRYKQGMTIEQALFGGKYKGKVIK